ncbi:MAG: hypothetical protein GXY74_01305 [Phycisphaerae bacterium]|nr:hypothetical protein [Phycisphaerae bacterium]
MRTTRIEIEGRQGCYATISRRRGSPDIEVVILTPKCPDGTTLEVTARGDADSENARRRFARNLHRILEGCEGANGDVEAYYHEVERFAD